MRVGLGSRVLGPEYLRRGALDAVSDRGLLIRRLAIPPRAPNGVDSVGTDRLGPASDASGPVSVRIVRRDKTFGVSAELEAAGGWEDGTVSRRVEVGRRRYRARLCNIRFRLYF